MNRKKRHLAVRFSEKVREASNGCLEWIGTIGGHGYGVMWRNGGYQMAHRISWEMENGPIPDGLFIDHLCRNTICVNPAHLEPVTPQENILRSPIAPPALNARKLVCLEGHDLTGENLDSYHLRTGRRSCVICGRRRWREYYARKQAEKRGIAA